MIRLLVLLILLSLPIATTTLWAHGGSSHVLGTVTETADDHVVIKTPKGETVSISFHSDTHFKHNGVTAKDARPQVGDRLVADVSKEGESFIGKEIRFSTPKPK